MRLVRSLFSQIYHLCFLSLLLLLGSMLHEGSFWGMVKMEVEDGLRLTVLTKDPYGITTLVQPPLLRPCPRPPLSGWQAGRSAAFTIDAAALFVTIPNCWSQ